MTPTQLRDPQALSQLIHHTRASDQRDVGAAGSEAPSNEASDCAGTEDRNQDVGSTTRQYSTPRSANPMNSGRETRILRFHEHERSATCRGQSGHSVSLLDTRRAAAPA